MKKIIVALAAVAISAGFAAKADTTCAGPNNYPQKTDCPQQACAQQACPQQPCDAKPCEKACPFDGLNLTDAQKQQFKELREKAAQARKDAKQQRKQAKSDCKRNRLAEIKKILTPEQYVQFLENHFVNGGGNKSFDRQMPKHARGDHHARMQHRRTDGERMTNAVPAAKVQAAKKVEKAKK